MCVPACAWMRARVVSGDRMSSHVTGSTRGTIVTHHRHRVAGSLPAAAPAEAAATSLSGSRGSRRRVSFTRFRAKQFPGSLALVTLFVSSVSVSCVRFSTFRVLSGRFTVCSVTSPVEFSSLPISPQILLQFCTRPQRSRIHTSSCFAGSH